MDTLSRDKRSWNMSRIRGENTTPEIVVRSSLHRMGYRFRLHVKKLPGRPDIVLPKYNTVVFVHGCFWHHHHGCRYAYMPKSRKTFWKDKFNKNILRDRQVNKALRTLKWNILTIWECETENTSKLVAKITSYMKRHMKAAS